MTTYLTSNTSSASVPLYIINKNDLKAWLAKQPQNISAWVKTLKFTGEPWTYCLLPSIKGVLSGVVAGVPDKVDTWSLAHLPEALPPLVYHLEGNLSLEEQSKVGLGWQLGTYNFSTYKKNHKEYATLKLNKAVDMAAIEILAQSVSLARNLINTPANDMGPTELARRCKEVARKYKAQYSVIEGDELLSKNYPVIHTVGKASSDAPRLVDIRWGKKGPKITLVGKGVCFDTGGLDIKTASGMKLMKKDMGGAAVVLALAQLIMASKLQVRLRVLIPAVENSISGNAFRPMDILKTRKGLTVEIGNTDAEGRLILCDALSEADSENPDLLIDCATLTGAARVALGTDIPAFFTSDDKLAEKLYQHSFMQGEPIWRLPLWQGYRDMLNSPIADLNNAPESGYAGAITAALYLKEFVTSTKSWVHLDLMAWNIASKPGRPSGGEAMALRTLFSLIKERAA